MKYLRESVLRQWYARPHWLLLLAPLSLLNALIAPLRRKAQSRAARKPPIPVIIVGNITVGGTGKTPLLIALVKHLQSQGLRPGVISRGYGGTREGCVSVSDSSDVEVCGDEPVLIARLTGCPVVIGTKRAEAAFYLTQNTSCDVILCDDGLQHYRLARDFEIAVVDGQRGLGNGWLLPVGPLRERPGRLRQVDWVISNGPSSTLPVASQAMELAPVNWVNVATGQECGLDEINLNNAVAVAGIGNPQRFFDALKGLGFRGEARAFDDHYQYTGDDFVFAGERTVLMTAKDAVKCLPIASGNWWALHVEAALPEAFLRQITQQIKACV